ncbi:alpha beta-hydrolase [Lecanosticta acicola]|uniref:Alpha beta-hydrolase n=1 Tax=Lecanosticta acicola TaxID=111012 RepID=A0AAI8Z5N1_9PEZI|nr:alpha beta-hydrolase [Lecanosticta acicola]
MKTTAATLALTGSAAAQMMAGYVPSSQFLASNPGGAIPAGVQAPSQQGFSNATIHPSRGGLAVCVSGLVPVQATAMNMRFNLSLPTNQSQVTEMFVESVTSGSMAMQKIMEGTQMINGSYQIGATLCTPANNTKPSGVQILTHGIGFDRSYWDFAPGYSYVDVATQNNYATFFYDRLGVGMSSKPDAISVVQSFMELEIANVLAKNLKNGTYSGLSFQKVVGAGHSFGSVITEGITAKYPTTLDGAILTGFSTNSTAMPTFLQALNLAIASQNAPYRFSSPDLTNGYLVSSSAISTQIGFFRAPGFDPAILNLAEATKGTVTLGELLTTTAVVLPASNYTRPVAVVNGDNDLPFCFGNCSYPTNQAQAALTMLYQNSNATGTYLAPTTGHGLNLHYSAVAAYHYIQDFVNENVGTS